MATQKDYANATFTSRTGDATTNSLLHTDIKDGGHDILTVKPEGDGVRVFLNSDLADWSPIDTLVTNYTAECPVP